MTPNEMTTLISGPKDSKDGRTIVSEALRSAGRASSNALAGKLRVVSSERAQPALFDVMMTVDDRGGAKILRSLTIPKDKEFSGTEISLTVCGSLSAALSSLDLYLRALLSLVGVAFHIELGDLHWECDSGTEARAEGGVLDWEGLTDAMVEKMAPKGSASSESEVISSHCDSEGVSVRCGLIVMPTRPEDTEKTCALRLFRFCNFSPLFPISPRCALLRAVSAVKWKEYGLSRRGRSAKKLPFTQSTEDCSVECKLNSTANLIGSILLLLYVDKPDVKYESKNKRGLLLSDDEVRVVTACIEDGLSSLKERGSRLLCTQTEVERAIMLSSAIPGIAESIADIIRAAPNGEVFRARTRAQLGIEEEGRPGSEEEKDVPYEQQIHKMLASIALTPEELSDHIMAEMEGNDAGEERS
eukprot:438409_1